MRSRETTLATRIATTLTTAAIVSAAIALVTGMLLADALIASRAEGSIAAAVRVMQVELDESPAVADHVEAEAHTLGIDGRVAIVEGGRVLFGDPELPPSIKEGCKVSSEVSPPELVCGAPLHSRPGATVLVAVPAARLHGHRPALLIAAGIVLLVVAVAARAVGGALARRALTPLEELRRAVADTDAAAPGTVALPHPTDLAEIDALRDALASLLSRLDEELGRARRFAASAAHELRTPLATIRAQLELAHESPDASDQAWTTARLIRTTARLEALTERLLVLATPHHALAVDHCSSMAQIVEDLVERRFGEHAQRLELEVCDADALVRGDEHLLATMLDNLVDNALKFSTGPVRVVVSVEDDEVIVDVEDEGPGVSQSDELELFEPFHRGSDVRRRPGHGLGLALTRHIARAHGARVSFVHGGRPGATARVRLPLLC